MNWVEGTYSDTLMDGEKLVGCARHMDTGRHLPWVFRPYHIETHGEIRDREEARRIVEDCI